jgi:hypothetical protein
MGAGSTGINSGVYGGGGGGGGHTKDGGAGSYGTVTEAEGGAGGYEYGEIGRYGDDTFYLGSGGGGGAGNGTDSGGDGGNGGGCVILECMYTGDDTNVLISGNITANGEDGSNGDSTGCGGGGGGSGGTILVKGKNIHIESGVFSVAAGDGGDKGGTGGGGGGGGTGGHIKVFFEGCDSSTGHSTTRGNGGDGDPDDGTRGQAGSGSRITYWYNYTTQDPPETYSPILPYHDSGTLVSAAYATGYEADFGKIRWCATTLSGTTVKFQLATNNDNSTWNFKGPDGTASTYYETSGTDIHSGHDGDRYIKYKVYLTSTQPGNTSTLSKVGITFTEMAEEVISFTVTDYSTDGIRFGLVNPGIDNQPADGQPGQGTVVLTVSSETNVDVDIQIKGSDFTGPSTIVIGNVKYDDDHDPSGSIIMTDNYVTWYTVLQPLTGDDVTQGYHWISIPDGQLAGDYTSTFYYQAVKSSP